MHPESESATVNSLIIENSGPIESVPDAGVLELHVQLELLFKVHEQGRGQQSDSYIAGSNHAMTLARMHVASLLLGRCPQTRALLAFSRRDVSADLTWRAHRRIAE